MLHNLLRDRRVASKSHCLIPMAHTAQHWAMTIPLQFHRRLMRRDENYSPTPNIRAVLIRTCAHRSAHHCFLARPSAPIARPCRPITHNPTCRTPDTSVPRRNPQVLAPPSSAPPAPPAGGWTSRASAGPWAPWPCCGGGWRQGTCAGRTWRGGHHDLQRPASGLCFAAVLTRF